MTGSTGAGTDGAGIGRCDCRRSRISRKLGRVLCRYSVWNSDFLAATGKQRQQKSQCKHEQKRMESESVYTHSSYYCQIGASPRNTRDPNLVPECRLQDSGNVCALIFAHFPGRKKQQKPAAAPGIILHPDRSAVCLNNSS